jgi:hypothetical protein
MSSEETARRSPTPDRPAGDGRGARARGPARPPVRIEFHGLRAVVEPAPVGLLDPALTTGRREYRAGGRRGFEGVAAQEPQFLVKAAGRIELFSGLVPRVAALLGRAGYPVEVVDRTRPRPRLRLDVARLGSRNSEASDFVRTLAGHGRGQVVAAAGDRPDRIALLIRAFPEAFVTVAVASRRAAWRIGEQVGRRVSEPVEVFTRGLCGSDRRVRVATFNSLDEKQADLVVFADAAEVLHARASDLFARMVNQRAYGFTPAEPSGSRAGLWIESRLGPAIYRVPGLAARPAEVAVADSPWIAVPAGAEGLEWKRALWRDERRNGVIAGVAGALAGGDREALWRHGLLLQEGSDRGDERAGPGRVAVLVESPEHGGELARLLPGWDLRSGRPGESSGEAAAPDRSILTLVHAHHRDRLDVDVLVRADGGAGALDLPGFPAARREAPGRRVVVVDLGDDFDGAAEAATRCRLRAYEELGWRVAAAARWGCRA